MKGKLILLIILLIIFGWIGYHMLTDTVELAEVVPTNESGSYISYINIDGFQATIENQKDGEVYYFYQADLMKLYKYNHGDWSKPFKVTYDNDTVSMNTHAKIVTGVYYMNNTPID